MSCDCNKNSLREFTTHSHIYLQLSGWKELLSQPLNHCTRSNARRDSQQDTDFGPYAKKGAPSIKKLLPKDSEELPKGTT